MTPYGRMPGRRKPRRQSPFLLHRLIPQLAPVTVARVAPLDLSAFYGTGPGQILWHLDPAKAVLDGNGNVVSVPNSGGAGAAFAATKAGTAAITKTAAGLLNIASGAYLLLANPADMIGVRMFAVVAMDPPPSSSNFIPFAGQSGTTAPGERTTIRTSGDGTNLVLTRWNGTADENSLVVGTSHPGATLHLFEIENAGGFIRYFIDGVQSGATIAAQAGWSDFRVNRIFSGATTAKMAGQAGDIASMVTDGSAAMDARAAQIRLAIADHHGIALPADAVLEGLRGTGEGQIVLDFDATTTVDNAGVPVSMPNRGGLGSAYDATFTGTPTKPDAGTITMPAGTFVEWPVMDAAGHRIFWVANRTATGQPYTLGGTLDTNSGSLRLLHGTNTPEGVLTSNYSASYAGTSNSAVNGLDRRTNLRSLSEFESGPQRLVAGLNGDVRLGFAGRPYPFPLEAFGRGAAGASPYWSGHLQRLIVVKPMGDLVAFDQRLDRIRQALLVKYPPQ